MICKIVFDLSEVLIQGLVGVEKQLAQILPVPENEILSCFGGELLDEICVGNISEDTYLQKILTESPGKRAGPGRAGRDWRKALEKEGWSITHDPMFLQVGGVEMYIDLGAEKLIAAEKGDQKIAIEIKSFVNVSVIYDFHLAIGQYRNYLLALSKEDPERRLYLAVPEDVFDRFFALQFIQEALVYNDVNYMVYDVTEEVIVRWQK